jgi:RimJ/RimL family protein N-acetyltransferase
MVNIDAGICQLRNLMPQDAESMARYANNKNIWNNVRDYFPKPYLLQDAEAFIHEAGKQQPPNNLAIVYQNECVGVIGFYPMRDVYRLCADFGYWLGEPFWGKGIMSAAAPAMIDYIFSNFDIVRLQSSVFDFNAASMRVLEKAGFVLENIAIKGAVKNGRLIDEHRFFLLKPGV